MSSIAKGTAINFGFRIASLVLTVVVTVVTARLGPTDRGVYSLLTLIVATFATAFSGLGSLLSHRIARHGEAAPELASSGMALGALIGLVAGLPFLAIALWPPAAPYDQLKWLAIIVPGALWPQIANGLYLGQGSMLRFNLNNILMPFAFVTSCGLIALLAPPITLGSIVCSWAAANVLASSYALGSVWKYVGLPRPHIGRLLAEYRFVLQVGLANVVAFLNYRMDLLLVEMLLGLDAMGVYSIAVALSELLWLISSSSTMAAFRMIGAAEPGESARLTLRIMRINFALLALAAPCLALGAWLLLPRVIGAEYQASLQPLLLLLPGSVLFGAAGILSTFYTNHLGRPDIPTKLVAFSTVINLTLSLLLIPRLGLAGAALASSVAYLISILASLFVFARHAGFDRRDMLRGGRP